MFSPLIHLHTNIYQHSWKWSVISPYHYVDVYILCVCTGVDSLKLVLSSHQHYHAKGARRWGPLGHWLTRVVGRPPSGTNRPQCSPAGLVRASSGLDTTVELVLSGFASVLGLHLVHLSLNRCSDVFCDFMSGQSVLVTCILAQKHILHSLEGKV